MRWCLAPVVLLLAAACARPFTAPPAEPPAPPPPPTARVILNNEGEAQLAQSPFSEPTLRRADYDLQATAITRGVALVVEPAANAPIYVSNLLAAALVRRFSGHLLIRDALASPVVFLIRPLIASDATTTDGTLIVDWALKSEEGEIVGALYASRRLSGSISSNDPWSAFTPEDAEFIAIQTAANLLETPALKTALQRGEISAQVALTPTPPARPITVTKQGSQPAPRFAPKPKARSN